MLLLRDDIVQGGTGVEAATWSISRWVSGEEDEGEDDEGNDDAAAVGHPSLSCMGTRDNEMKSASLSKRVRLIKTFARAQP